MALRYLASRLVATRTVLTAAGHHHHDNQQGHDEDSYDANLHPPTRLVGL
ncbi:MAG: hypothetical protein M3454_03455 [Actinomycetota bacterium]|nr:hypothetical protein [Actinomycetota bacterium]